MSERMFTLDEYEDVKRRSYMAGLDAAREAVAAEFPLPRYQSEQDAALAAIDALKEKS